MEKINVLMMAYETEDFVGAALGSIYDIADEIVVLEGGWTPGAASHSRDSTWQIIRDFPDPEKKIIRQHSDLPRVEFYKFASPAHEENTVLQENQVYYNGKALQQQLVARDHAFRQLKDPRGWLFFVDSDEVYLQEDLKNIFDVVDAMKEDFNSFTLLGKNFYFGYKYYAKEYYQRIVNIPEPHLRPYMRRTCALGWDGFEPGDLLADSKKSRIKERNRSSMSNADIPEDIGSFFHYGYVGKDRVRRKLSMWNEDLVNTWFKRHEDLWNGFKYDGRGVHLLQGANPVYHKYLLYEFTGIHPLGVTVE
jgi:hypothetical protein